MVPSLLVVPLSRYNMAISPIILRYLGRALKQRSVVIKIAPKCKDKYLSSISTRLDAASG